MYGYFVSSGYRGFVDGTWMLFPTESEYYEYMKELENYNYKRAFILDFNVVGDITSKIVDHQNDYLA